MESSLTVNKAQLPVHVGIIMDGNGRWAKQRGKIRSQGHLAGVTNAKTIAKAAADLGIKYLTLYVFSTENWKRTEQEVGYLMDLIRSHLRDEFQFYKENGIRIKHLGNLDGLPVDIQEEILKAQKDTESFTGMTIVLAINYGGRDEIIRGVRKLISKEKSGAIDISNGITEEMISSQFDIPELPEMDLLIRTGGEQRVSNFLLWHSAYAEFIFSDTLWPDYSPEEFNSHIIEFQKRTRRFGAVPV